MSYDTDTQLEIKFLDALRVSFPQYLQLQYGSGRGKQKIFKVRQDNRLVRWRNIKRKKQIVDSTREDSIWSSA